MISVDLSSDLSSQIEPSFPALEGEVLITGPTGKSYPPPSLNAFLLQSIDIYMHICSIINKLLKGLYQDYLSFIAYYYFSNFPHIKLY